MTRALIVSVQTPDAQLAAFDESLLELKQLLDTLGVEDTETVIQRKKSIDPAMYAGKGFLKSIAENKDVDMIVFDAFLSPGQKNNIEELTEFRAIDRTDVILDIFENHARTRESKIQVEIARLNIVLSGLKGKNRKYAQQVGAIGVKGGKGERQIELDRRVIGRKLSKLKKSLKNIEKRRSLTMKGREKELNVSLVGYTNAGKSTLMNQLTRAEVLCENKLFVTLDTKTKQWFIDDELTALLSDTVGFIRNLPHQLVASFRSTFKVVEKSDIILMVIDISSSDVENQIETTREVIKDMSLQDISSVIVFNKIDNVDEKLVERYRNLFPEAVFVSARKKKNIKNIGENVKKIQRTLHCQ